MLFTVALALANLHAQTPTPAASASSAAAPTATPQPRHENWTTIRLADSGLPVAAIGGVPLSKVDLRGCTRELLRMQWRAHDPIDLYVIRPSGAQKMPVVLFLYNYTYDTDLFREERWCDLAKQNGFAVVGFGSALSPQRFHTPRPMKQWFVSELQEALATSTHDVQMVLDYLSTRGDLDMRHVAVFGQGSGGAIAILAAAADPRIRALDLMDPWGDWPDWLRDCTRIPAEERADYLKPEFLQKVSTLDPITYLPQLRGRAIRIYQVMDDPATPASARDKIAAAAPKADQVKRYPDVSKEAAALGANGIVGWLGEQVSPHAAHSGSTQ
jgi:dienelactone hydrolase